MTTNCSMIYVFSTRKFQEQNMSRTYQEHVVYTNCFECIKQKYQNLTKVIIVWLLLNWTKSFQKPFRSLHWPITLRIHTQKIQSNLCKLMFYWCSTDVLLMEFLCTVKLDFKELLNKEQIDFKELFTDYQLFYTINLLLNKELLPI